MFSTTAWRICILIPEHGQPVSLHRSRTAALSACVALHFRGCGLPDEPTDDPSNKLIGDLLCVSLAVPFPPVFRRAKLGLREGKKKHFSNTNGTSPASRQGAWTLSKPAPCLHLPFLRTSEKSGKSTISLKKEEKNKFFCFSEFVTSIFWTDCLDKQYLNRT